MSGIKKDKFTKNFGYLLSFVFLILALYPLLNDKNVNFLFFLFASLSLALTVFYPRIFKIPANLWFQLGNILHKIISPLIMFTVYIFSIVFFGLVMKIFRKDILNKKFDKKTKSYWIAKEKSKMKDHNLHDQF
tara:strand:- start:483 stop:881 length:399 start_codon:yes stop_codon:yes gene_type:complete